MSEISRITSTAALLRTEAEKQADDQPVADLAIALAEQFEYIAATSADRVLLEKTAHAADAITVALTEE